MKIYLKCLLLLLSVTFCLNSWGRHNAGRGGSNKNATIKKMIFCIDASYKDEENPYGGFVFSAISDKGVSFNLVPHIIYGGECRVVSDFDISNWEKTTYRVQAIFINAQLNQNLSGSLDSSVYCSLRTYEHSQLSNIDTLFLIMDRNHSEFRTGAC